MSEVRELLVETARRVFQAQLGSLNSEDRSAGDLRNRVWDAAVDAGIAHALHPAMGVDISLADAAALLRPAAYYAAPIPLAETFLAQWLLASAGFEVPITCMTVGGNLLSCDRVSQGWRVRGVLLRVPWLRYSSHVVLPFDVGGVFSVAFMSNETLNLRHGHNLAGEPRDDLPVDTVVADIRPIPDFGVDRLRGLGAAFKCIQISGALDRILDLTIQYVQQRVQFGKPLAKLQAVQQLCAVLAGHAAVATASADLALGALEMDIDKYRIAAAKVRCGEAAGAATAIAHQLHGAIGVTREYPLHLLTSRLWSWRDEFGNESHWSSWLGREVAAAGPRGLWQLITEVA